MKKYTKLIIELDYRLTITIYTSGYRGMLGSLSNRLLRAFEMGWSGTGIEIDLWEGVT